MVIGRSSCCHVLLHHKAMVSIFNSSLYDLCKLLYIKAGLEHQQRSKKLLSSLFANLKTFPSKMLRLNVKKV